MVINNLTTYKAYGEKVQFEYKEYKFRAPAMRKQLVENNSQKVMQAIYYLSPDLKLPYPKFFTRRPWGRLFVIGANWWFQKHYRIHEPQ